MAVRIRMKMMGRRHRPFFRIVAADSRKPRDGKVLEELGTYDPMIQKTDDRVRLNSERVKYWLSVGALPSEKVGFLLKKYLDKAPAPGTPHEPVEKSAPVAQPAQVEEPAAEEAPAEETPAAEDSAGESEQSE